MRTNFENIEFEINFINYEVDFDYQPYEAQTHNYPGCAASVEVYWLVSVGGANAEELGMELEDLDETTIELLEAAALKYVLDN